MPKKSKTPARTGFSGQRRAALLGIFAVVGLIYSVSSFYRITHPPRTQFKRPHVLFSIESGTQSMSMMNQYVWISPIKVLVLRQQIAATQSAYVFDTDSGLQSAAPTGLARAMKGAWMVDLTRSVSPDGKWMLAQIVGKNGVIRIETISTSDAEPGRTIAPTSASTIANESFAAPEWLADSVHWLAIAETQGAKGRLIESGLGQTVRTGPSAEWFGDIIGCDRPGNPIVLADAGTGPNLETYNAKTGKLISSAPLKVSANKSLVTDAIISPMRDRVAYINSVPGQCYFSDSVTRLIPYLRRFRSAPLYSIWVAHLDGMHAVEIAEFEQNKQIEFSNMIVQLQWRPDESTVSFMRDGKLWEVSLY